jgi:nicotinate-nucleotide adenylyltransferase
MTGRVQRIGLLGGTFDPIHVGHLEAASAVRAAVGLDQVLVVPAHDPPHRDADPHASAFHRFAMICLAIAGRPEYRASDVELRRHGPSYTALTLRDLHTEGWTPEQLYFIVGADAFAEIASWYDFPAILDACRFAVVARPGMTLEAAVARTPSLRERVGRTIVLVEAATPAVSSTAIRARLMSGGSIDGMVPAAVAQHIAAHELYAKGRKMMNGNPREYV